MSGLEILGIVGSVASVASIAINFVQGSANRQISRQLKHFVLTTYEEACELRKASTDALGTENPEKRARALERIRAFSSSIETTLEKYQQVYIKKSRP